MQDAIRSALASSLLRVLELEPQISMKDAIARVAQVWKSLNLPPADSAWIESELQEISSSYQQLGVINPKRLADVGLKPWFFLINAGAGWLEALVPHIKETCGATSQYIIYGDWDLLLILNGTDDEAQQQLKLITSMLRGDRPMYFSASGIPYAYRYKSRDYTRVVQISDERLNEVAAKYDSKDCAQDKSALEKAGLLLGPVWLPKGASTERVIAFTGIDIVGRGELRGEELLSSLLQQNVLQKTLVHLFEVAQGRPFHFFAKLACASMTELDEATNAIAFTRIGPIRLQGSTVVVANGVDNLPLLRKAPVKAIEIRPFVVVEDIELLAKELLADQDPNAIAEFNKLQTEQKLVVLRALRRVSQAEAIGGNKAWSPNLLKAVKSFRREVLDPTIPNRLTGPVMEAAVAVESAVKHAVRGLIEEVFSGDFKQAQNELRLPTRDLRTLSLGKATEALKTAAGDKRFERYAESLSPRRIDQLQRFTNYRNAWAHGEPPWDSMLDIIDHASCALELAMEIIRWAESDLPSPVERTSSIGPVARPPEILLPETPSGRQPGAFISYSSRDKEIAVRIATALRATGYQVWYDDWEIGPGESIVEKIEQGLAKNDTLVVLLSPASVQSKWVRRELDTALMKQLTGQSVKIVPALIQKCEVPEVLTSIKYVDFTESFQQGIIQLIQALSARIAAA